MWFILSFMLLIVILGLHLGWVGLVWCYRLIYTPVFIHGEVDNLAVVKLI